MTSLRAILVCVDYSDLLAITLPYNRHHFSEVLVVTSHADKKTQWVAAENSAQCFLTDSFWGRGARFNKWLALEQGLDSFGREGWLCIMDADVLWPRNVDWLGFMHNKGNVPLKCPSTGTQQQGNLFTPLRRMWNEWPHFPAGSGIWDMEVDTLGGGSFISEKDWHRFPLHPQQHEFAGYTQIFHASDPHLPSPPWHQTDWIHAGGADSFFQALWPDDCKVRPPFEVLHLGPAGVNWIGRTTPMIDGTIPAYAEERRQAMLDVWAGRRGKHGDDRFRHERLT